MASQTFVSDIFSKVSSVRLPGTSCSRIHANIRTETQNNSIHMTKTFTLIETQLRFNRTLMLHFYPPKQNNKKKFFLAVVHLSCFYTGMSENRAVNKAVRLSPKISPSTKLHHRVTNAGRIHLNRRAWYCCLRMQEVDPVPNASHFISFPVTQPLETRWREQSSGKLEWPHPTCSRSQDIAAHFHKCINAFSLSWEMCSCLIKKKPLADYLTALLQPNDFFMAKASTASFLNYILYLLSNCICCFQLVKHQDIVTLWSIIG